MTDVVALLDEGDLDLGDYTDEEVLVAMPDIPEGGHVVELPAADALDPDDRAVAVDTARRSLRARGLLDRADDLDDIEIPTGPLGLAVEAIATARVVVIAERTLDDTTRERAWFGVDQIAVLDHEPDGQGAHRFILRRPDRAADAIAGFLDPEAWAAHDSGAMVYDVRGAPPAGWGAVDAATLAPRLASKAFATGGGDADRELLLAGGPGAVWLLSVPPGADERPIVRAATVSTATLGQVAAALLGAAS